MRYLFLLLLTILPFNASAVTVSDFQSQGASGGRYMLGDDYLIRVGGSSGVISVFSATDYETNVTSDDNIPNKKYVDDKFISGSYSPTVTDISNIASSSASEHRYYQHGNMVTAFGRVTIDPTAADTTTSIELSLPVASDFSAVDEGSGVCSAFGTIFGYTGGMISVAANDRIRLTFISDSAAGSQIFQCIWSYEVI